MAQGKSGKTSGVNKLIGDFTNEFMGVLKDFNESDKIDKTLEITAKTKGVKSTTEEIKKLNKEISSVKKTLKDGDITQDMYANSSQLNESVESNIKTLDELYKKAKTKESNMSALGIGDTKKFYETYYVLEKQLSSMGKELPNKFKKAFDEIQHMSDAVIEGSERARGNDFDISLSEIKDTAVKRANRILANAVSEIKAQYRLDAESRIAELTEKKERLGSSSSSSAAVNNLKELNKLGFTDDGEIDRSKLIFRNYEQCEKVIENIRENISKISGEDSENNLDVIESANQLLEELESRLTIIGENKAFDKMTNNAKNQINEAWEKGIIDDEQKARAENELEELRSSVDAGETSAIEASGVYEAFGESLVQTAKDANETASSITKLQRLIKHGINSDGNFKTYADFFQQGEENDNFIKKLEKPISFLEEHRDLLDWDQAGIFHEARSLLSELRAVQNGYSDYSADREEWLNRNNRYNGEFDPNESEEESAALGQEEAESFDKIEDSAEDAAEAKRKFVEANQEVFDSIVNTLKWLGDEDEGFRKLADNLSDALSQFGDFSSSSNFSNFIEALDKIIEKIEEVANKTGKIGLNLNYKEDSAMDVEQATKATDAYYAKILSNMRTKAKNIQASGVDIAELLFLNPKVSDLSRRYNDSLTTAKEEFALGNIDQLNRSNEENAKAYLQYFDMLRTARDNVKQVIAGYEEMLKTGVDKEGNKLEADDIKNITDLIEDYKNQWKVLLAPRALPAYTITEVAQNVNKINGVTSMGKQSAADKKKKAGSKIAEMLGIEQQDTEQSSENIEKINESLLTLSKTLEDIKGLLLSISQKDLFGELFGDEDGKLDSIANKIAEIINKVKELNQISSDDTEVANGVEEVADSLSVGEKRLQKFIDTATQLPPVEEGFTRLVHLTSDTNSEKIAENGLNYKGVLSSTTLPISEYLENGYQNVVDVLRDATYGLNAVILDIPSEQLGVYEQATGSIDHVAKEFVRGTIDIENELLSLNERFNSSHTPIQEFIDEILKAEQAEKEMASQTGEVQRPGMKYSEALTRNATRFFGEDFTSKLAEARLAQSPDFSSEGKEGMESYAEGVKEGEATVKDSVTDVMEAGEEAGMEALDEHSPSVIYRIMGQNSMEGYILGVKDKQFEVMDAVGNVLKSGFLNNDTDAKWINDWWEGLISKDTFSIEKQDLLPGSNQSVIKEAFNKDIGWQEVQEKNLTDALKSTALAVRDVAKANEERAKSEKELSTEVEKAAKKEKVYEGEFMDEGERSSRNMKRTKRSNELYEYEEEISPGRTRRYQEKYNRRTQDWEVDEIISTDYDKLVAEAVDATVKLEKAQHNLNIEQQKQRPNIDLIMEYNAQIREAQERLDRATLSARDFAEETVAVVNDTDPHYNTNYVMGMFNDAVNEQSFFKLSNENIRFYSKLRSENESTQRSIDATTKALAAFENQVRSTEYSYDQSLAPGLTKPVTKQSDLDELRARRDEVLNRINGLRGTAATVDDITEIRRMISEYQLLAKAKRDANNVVDKNLGGDTLEVKVSKQIAHIDKLIARSEQYGDVTQDVTDKLKEQRKALQDTISADPNTGKISTDIEAKDFYEVQSNVKILGAQLDSNISKIKEQKKLINEYLKAYANQQKALNNIEVLQAKGESQNASAIAAETRKMENAAKEMEKAEKALRNKGFDFSTIQEDMDNIAAEKGNIKGKYFDRENAKAYKGLDADYNSLDKYLQDSGKYTESFKKKVEDLKAELKSLMNQGLDFNNKDAQFKLEDIRQKIADIKTEAKSDDVQRALENTIEKTRYKITKFIKENSAMTDEFRSKLRNLQIRLDGTDLTKAEVNDIVNSFIKLENEITEAGQTGKSFFSTIRERLTGLNAQLIAQYLSFQDIIRYARQAATNVIQLNDAFVELSKVSDTSLKTLESDFQSYANIAKDIGGTITDTINATSDWARMGYNVPDSKQLAEVAMLYKNVGDGIDINTANESLISTLQGFQLEADEAESVIDKFNEVSNNFAISSGGIGEGLQRSAAAFNAANTDLSQSIALVTATNEIVQDPDTVGNMWTTVSARIRGAKTELENMGEDTEDMVESTSKLRDLVKGITGVDIMVDENTFKDIYTIVTQIGEKWGEINDIDQAALLEALAGKRQANKLAAVLGNLDHLKEAYQTAEEAAGSAEREQANFEKGITYSVNQAKAALEELSYDALDSDFLKGLVDTGTDALEMLDSLIDKFGLLQTAIVAIGTVWGSQRLGLFNTNDSGTIFGAITQSINKTNRVNQYQSILDQFENNKDSLLSFDFDKYKDNSAFDFDVIDDFKKIQDEANKTGKTGEQAFEDIQTKISEVSSQSTDLGQSFKQVGLSIINGLASAAISIGISLLIQGISDVIDKLIITRKEAEALSAEFDNTFSSNVSQQAKSIKDLSEIEEEYQELSKGVNVLGENVSLTDEEFEKYNQITQTIADNIPNLVQGYTDQGTAIIKLKDNVESLTEAYKVNQETAAQDLYEQTDDKGKHTVIEGVYKKAQQDITPIEITESDNTGAYSHQLKIDIETQLETREKLAKATQEQLKDIYINGNLYERQLLSSYFENGKNLDDNYNEIHNKLQKDSAELVNRLEADTKRVSEAGLTYLRAYQGYYTELSSDQQKFVEAIMNSIDFEFANENDLFNQDNMEIYAKEVMELIKDLSPDELKDLEVAINFSTLWNNDEISYDEYVEKIQGLAVLLEKLFPGNEQIQKSIKLAFGVPDEEELSKEKDVFLNRLANSRTEGAAGMPSEVADKYKAQLSPVADAWYDSLTKSEQKFVKNLSSTDLAEAVKFESTEEFDKWLEKLQSDADQNSIKIKASAAIDSMADMKTATSSLNDLWKQTVEYQAKLGRDKKYTDANGNITKQTDDNGLALGFADPELINNVESAFYKFSEELKAEGNDAAANKINQALEDFETTLVRFPDDAEKAQDAIDTLITEYIDQTSVIKNLTEQNKEWSIAQLEAMGITNATEVVESRLHDTYRYNIKALEELTDVVKNYNEAMKNAKDQGAKDQALGDLTAGVNKTIANYDEEGNILSDSPQVNDDFVKRHLEDVQAMAEGDEEALRRVRLAAAKGAVMEVTTNIPTDAAEQQISGLMDMVAQADAMNIEPGASIDDSDFMKALNEMIRSAGLTQEQVNAAFNAMGYEAKWKPNRQKVKLPGGAHVTSVPSEAAKYLGLQGTTIEWDWVDAEFDFPSLDVITKKGGAKANYHPGGGSSSGGGGGGGGGNANQGDTSKGKTEDDLQSFDWIEKKIQRLEEAVSSLDKTVNNTFRNWTKRNTKLGDEISKVTKELEVQEYAQEKYAKYADKIQNKKDHKKNRMYQVDKMPQKKDYKDNEEQYDYDLDQWKKANEIWKSGKYQKRVREGLYNNKEDIQKIQNKYLANLINEYQTWYEKSIAAKQAAEDLRIKLAELNKQKFDNLTTQLEEINGLLEKQVDLIDKRIERAEAKGFFVDESFYKDQIALAEKEMENVQNTLNKHVAQLNYQVGLGEGNGGVDPNSTEWNAMVQQIMDDNLQLEELNNHIIELYDNIKKVEWEKFSWLEDRLKRINAEADHLIKFVSVNDMFEKNGNFKNTGWGNAALVAAQYNNAFAEAERYASEYIEWKDKMNDDSYIAASWDNKEDVEHLEELKDGWWSAKEALIDYMQAMKSLVEEAINKHLENLQDVINKYKEALSSAKDLYDFQKNIADQTKQIESLQKQLRAVQGDDSESARKRRQELTNQLESAQQQLQETEWDRYISQTGEMLDDLYEDYEELLNARLDDIIDLMKDMVTEINNNSDNVREGIKAMLRQFGIDTNQLEYFKNFAEGNSKDLVGAINDGKLANENTVISKTLKTTKGYIERIVETTSKINEILDGSRNIVYDKNTGIVSIKFANDASSKNTSPDTPQASLEYMVGQDEAKKYKGIESDLARQKKQRDNIEKSYQTYLLNNKPKYEQISRKKNQTPGDKNFILAYTNQVKMYEASLRNTDNTIKILEKKLEDLRESYIPTSSSGRVLGAYAKGSRKIPHDQLAWTQEEGSEVIFRKSDGAMLTPLGQGDMVFTNEMSKTLWAIAKGGIPTNANIIVPDIAGNRNTTVTANNEITITLPNVQDYASFKHDLQNDDNFEKFIQEVTIGQVWGNNKLNKRKY